MSLFLLSVFGLPSSGLVNEKQKQINPGRVVKDTYNKEEESSKPKSYLILKHNEYPWGVCFPKGNHNYPQWALNWTYEAMQRWNQSYREYERKNIPVKEIAGPCGGVESYRGWPSGDLFVWSCDSSKYNLIFPEFGPPKHSNNLAYHEPIDPIFGSFYGKIVMSNKKEWKKAHFINVKIHELGHALGIPHLREHQTEIMTSHGFGCATGGKEEICELTYSDFKSFVEPFFLEPFSLLHGSMSGICY